MRMVDAAEYMQPCSALASGGAPASHCGSAPGSSSASPHSAFLQQWSTYVAPRLIQLLQRLQQEQVAQALAVAQARRCRRRGCLALLPAASSQLPCLAFCWISYAVKLLARCHQAVRCPGSSRAAVGVCLLLAGSRPDSPSLPL